MNKELTREDIFHNLDGLKLKLLYLRDALICMLQDVPVKHFVTLNGNFPPNHSDRMERLLSILRTIDMQYMKDVKSFILNNNDIDLAAEYGKLDLPIWQLVILSSRFKGDGEVETAISTCANKFLEDVYFVKTKMLKRDFFDFDTHEVARQVLFLEEIAEQKPNGVSPAENNPGWGQLEEIMKKQGYTFSEGI